ncbi:MinD/ParA family protein [Syntrophus gentianae]|nr:MinD/ParA family protein [Syntrophus gentianae]
MDQAESLRELVQEKITSKSAILSNEAKKMIFGRKNSERVRTIAITSGKGGVGKTNITASLACALARMNKKTFVLDADAGLANIDVVLGLTPKYNLYHVLAGERKLSEVIVSGPCGVKILPSASGIQEMTNLSRGQKLTLLEDLDSIQETLDFMLIDTAAGIASNVMYFNMAAREIVVIATPEPTSLTDAYALIKVLHQKYAKKRFRLLINMVNSAAEAHNVFLRLSHATEHFLNVNIEYLGYILQDKKLQDAVRMQQAFVELYPGSQASLCIKKIAEKICSENPEYDENGNISFFGDKRLGNECRSKRT